VTISFGTDGRQHDTKHVEQQGHGNDLKHQESVASFRLDQVLCGLRGVDSATGKLTVSGDIRCSFYLGRPLADFFPDDAAAATAWHRKFCQHIGATELQRKDPMATRPSIAAARTAPLLRELEKHDARVAGPARFLELVWQMWCASGGVGLKEQRITPDENLAQYKAIVVFLDEWKATCDTFGKVVNSQRPHGFITIEQYSYWGLNLGALELQIKLAKKNGYYDRLLPALRTSAANENTHSLIRLAEPAMRVAEITRVAAQLLETSFIRADLARTFVCAGAGVSYVCDADQTLPIRVEALEAFRATGQRAFDLSRDQGNRREKKAAGTRDAAVVAAEEGQLAHLRRVAERTDLEVVKKRVFREYAVKYDGGKQAKLSALEKKIVDPRQFEDPKLAGRPSLFHVHSLIVMEGAPDGPGPLDAAIFKSAVGEAVLTVRPKLLGFEFLVTTGAGATSLQTIYELSHKSLVAACLGV
jgi:hypothetical protein